MASPESLKYFAFGISIAIATYSFVMSDHLWKKSFFQNCLIAAIVSCVAGIFLEVFGLLEISRGMTIVVMSSPMIYLSYFWLFRYFYKRMYDTEPYVTSASSMIGAPPMDMYSSAYKDGNRKKYPKDRKTTAGDFGFSFLQALVPIFTILGLIALVRLLNE